jgi:simple sugar transport system ATP-binding protein
MANDIIRVVDIEKGFGGVTVLKKASLTIAPGEIRCLAGENGCGKSTLIKVISGVYSHDGGRLELNGKVFERLSPIDAIREGVQVIYQDFSLFPNLTVAENLAINHQVEQGKKLVSWREMRSIARQCLAQIDVDIPLNNRVEDLTVADKQLVAISRALLNNARVIIMDEPTTALTQKEVDALFVIIRRLRERGISTLFVSHKMREMLEVSEKITIMRNGQVVADGPIADYDESSITRHMTGRDLAGEKYVWRGFPDTVREPLLKLENFTREGYFADVNLAVEAGEIVGVTGLLGSGRDKLALAMFGREPATSGRALRNGREVRLDSIQAAIDAGIAYVPEDRLTEGLFLDQSIERNMLVTTYERFRKFPGLLDFKCIREKTAELIGAYGIVAASTANPVRSLSGGNQQRVILARWMNSGAEVLVLNGPTVGVDVGSKFEIHRKLREVAAGGVGIVMFSDDAQELSVNCNRVLFIHKGRLVCEEPTETLTDAAISERLKSFK